MPYSRTRRKLGAFAVAFTDYPCAALDHLCGEHYQRRLNAGVSSACLIIEELALELAVFTAEFDWQWGICAKRR